MRTVPAVLARVTADLNQPRGSDVLLVVDVPETWLQQGATLQLRLPRLLTCLRCEGGGCDACGRRGAFAREKLGGQEGEPVVVTLPQGKAGACQALQLRLPGLGALSIEPDLPPGHLLLTVRAATAGQASSAAVTRLKGSQRRARFQFSFFSPLGLLAFGMIGFGILWWMLK